MTRSLTMKWPVVCLLAVLAGCGDDESPAPDEEDDGVLSAGLGATVFDMNRLMADEDLTGHQWITAAQVQGFLTAKGSYLARYTDPAFGKTAAVLIVERSKAHHISPLYMLARIETESSLVQSGSSAYLRQATGCGCPDGQGCSVSYAGFGNQIECAAAKLRGYFDDLDAGRTTITGWKPGVTKRTYDPCSVTPQNKATAALYTYTPWVGAYASQCGDDSVGGSSLVARAFSKFKAEYTWGNGTTTPSQCLSGTVGKNVPDGACVQSSSDAMWRQCFGGTFTSGSAAKPAGCTASYAWCYSGTLGRSVPARTCIQARYDRAWYQCVADGQFASAPAVPSSGDGPLGECASTYAL
jgi:hypothetical protein